MAEWTPYKITIPKASGRASGDGTILDIVHHVVHVPTARRILEDGQLRAGLIYDESRLNKSRTCVTWVSANTWGPGSIYGNVQFSFAWSKLIKNRDFYWVEVMTGYSPHAYRLLITDRDLRNSRYVTPYDPSVNRGPLRLRNGVWYWNGTYTSEFMIDGDIDLVDCIEFDFITHRRDKCRLYGNSCSDRIAPTYQVGGRVLAFLLGNDLHAVDRTLNAPSQFDRNRPLHYAVDTGVDGIIRALGNKDDRFGGAIKSQASSRAVLRGALALYGADQKEQARELVALINSEEVFNEALAAIVNEHFGINGWTLPK